MARSSGSKCVLLVLNSLYIIFSLALVAASLWLFVQVYEFTSLRNSNHYLLDYNVYWPQAVPWMFFVVSVFAVCVSTCGFAGTKKRSRRLLILYVIFQAIVILLLIAAAIIAFVFADNRATDSFIKDTVWDVYFQAKLDRDVETAFGNIEKKFHCCGADSPRDYKNWKNEFPRSCCDVYYHGFYDPYVLDCDFTNKLANERYGCSTVASKYARIAIQVLAAGSLLIAVIGIASLIVASTMSNNLKKKPRVIQQLESDSKKVLL